MTLPADSLLVLEMLNRLIEHRFLVFMTIKTKRCILLFQKQYLQETVPVMALFALFIFEGLVRDFIIEAGTHVFVAIKAGFAHAPASGLCSRAMHGKKGYCQKRTN